MPAIGIIASLLIEIVPHIIAGAKGAAEAFSAGKQIYDQIKGENRDATPEEVEQVRNLWKGAEADFMTDDEAGPAA